MGPSHRSTTQMQTTKHWSSQGYSGISAWCRAVGDGSSTQTRKRSAGSAVSTHLRCSSGVPPKLPGRKSPTSTASTRINSSNRFRSNRKKARTRKNKRKLRMTYRPSMATLMIGSPARWYLCKSFQSYFGKKKFWRKHLISSTWWGTSSAIQTTPNLLI